MNSILSNLRRSRDRSRTNSSTSPSKAKPLDILPDLTELSEQEEDEGRASAATSAIHLSPAFKPRNPKRDTPVLNGTDGVFVNGIFPAYPPRPSAYGVPKRARNPPSVHLESPLDSIDFRFSGLDFPFSQVPSSPESFSARSASPTPSVASSSSVSTVSSAASTSSAHAKALTPPTSDDESQDRLGEGSRLVRVPTFKSQRGIIGYVPGGRKQRSASEKSIVDMSLENNDGDDASWFAQDMSDSFVLSSPQVELAGHASRAGRSRFSKPLPSVPRLSIQALRSSQLDPTFPSRRKSYIPSRPPPPPPIRIVDVDDSDLNVFVAPPSPETPVSRPSPTMEEKTEELLALVASAALSAATTLSIPSGPSRLSNISSLVTPTSVTTSSFDFVIATPTLSEPITPRPPPRSSVPADISDMLEQSHNGPTRFDEGVMFTAEDLDLDELELEWTPNSDDESLPTTPRSPIVFSDFDLDSIPLEPYTPAVSLFFESSNDMYDGIAMPDSPLIRPCDDPAASPSHERTLRSRWSSSTLAESFAEQRTSHWMSRFAFSGLGGKLSPTKTSFSLRSPSKPSFNIPKSVFSSPTKKTSSASPLSSPSPSSPTKKLFSLTTSTAKAPRGLSRRSSNASICTSDSGESTFSASSSSSNGLRRKPIPIEIFIRS